MALYTKEEARQILEKALSFSTADACEINIYGSESEWSDPLMVAMPKNKAINSPFLQFLENHPFIFPLLRQLLGL